MIDQLKGIILRFGILIFSAGTYPYVLVTWYCVTIESVDKIIVSGCFIPGPRFNQHPSTTIRAPLNGSGKVNFISVTPKCLATGHIRDRYEARTGSTYRQELQDINPGRVQEKISKFCGFKISFHQIFRYWGY